MAGQGTAAKELIEDVGKLDMLLAPIGGGGLISGCATAAKAMIPGCTVIGVEPEAGNDAQQSLRDGKIVHIDVPKTIADGAQTQHVGQYTFPVMQHLVDDILTVTDSELIETMIFFAGRMKIVVEPTGCLGAAAVFGKHLEVRGKRVGVILSGGNIDLMSFASMIRGET
jgi:threonine dehydratase